MIFCVVSKQILRIQMRVLCLVCSVETYDQHHHELHLFLMNRTFVIYNKWWIRRIWALSDLCFLCDWTLCWLPREQQQQQQQQRVHTNDVMLCRLCKDRVDKRKQAYYERNVEASKQAHDTYIAKEKHKKYGSLLSRCKRLIEIHYSSDI
jgi:hypothetical protein